MSSVIAPIRSSLVPKGRALVRGLVLLLPIALALAIVSWWPRPSAVRPPAVVQRTTAEQERPTPEALERARASTVALEYGGGDSAGRRRVATGVVVSDQGDVLSIRVDPPEGHERESILARDSAGHKHAARWMAADPETGLTLLRIEADDIRPIRPSARAAILGAAVFLIGNPYGLGHSVSRGNVAGLNRRAEDGSRLLGGLIQVQVALHPGDSGALLADGEGGWIGLVRGGLAAPGAKDDNDLGFAIPAIDAMWVAGRLLSHGKVDRAFLGIKIARDSAEPGAKVASVIADSAAERAKLRPGDRIVRLDGRPISCSDDLTDRLDRMPADAEVRVDYLRGSGLEHVTIRTTARPHRPAPAAPAEPTPPSSPRPRPPACLTRYSSAWTGSNGSWPRNSGAAGLAKRIPDRPGRWVGMSLDRWARKFPEFFGTWGILPNTIHEDGPLIGSPSRGQDHLAPHGR